MSDESAKFLRVLPPTGDHQLVTDTLQSAIGAEYTEVVVLGFKDGKSYLLHSKIADAIRLLGAIEEMKLRMREVSSG